MRALADCYGYLDAWYSALSQPVHPVGSTAIDHGPSSVVAAPPPRRDGIPPPANPEPTFPLSQPVHRSGSTATSRPLSFPPASTAPRPGGFTELRMSIAAGLEVLPCTFDRPELRGQLLANFRWFAGHRATGAAAEFSHREQYAIMVPGDHLVLRRLSPGWSFDHVAADVVGLYPKPRSLRILERRLPALPSLQTLRDTTAAEVVLPVDFRPVQGRVCTLSVRCAAGHDEVVEQGLQDCPTSRQPRVPFALFVPDQSPCHEIAAYDEPPEFLAGASPILPVEAETEADEEDEVATFMQLVATAIGDSDAEDYAAKAPISEASLSNRSVAPECPVEVGETPGSEEPPSLLSSAKTLLHPSPGKDSYTIHPAYLRGSDVLGAELHLLS